MTLLIKVGSVVLMRSKPPFSMGEHISFVESAELSMWSRVYRMRFVCLVPPQQASAVPGDTFNMHSDILLSIYTIEILKEGDGVEIELT